MLCGPCARLALEPVPGHQTLPSLSLLSSLITTVWVRFPLPLLERSMLQFPNWSHCLQLLQLFLLLMNLSTYFSAKTLLVAVPWLQPESWLSLGCTLFSSPVCSLCPCNRLTSHTPSLFLFPKYNVCLQHGSHMLFPVPGTPFCSFPSKPSVKPQCPPVSLSFSHTPHPVCQETRWISICLLQNTPRRICLGLTVSAAADLRDNPLSP